MRRWKLQPGLGQAVIPASPQAEGSYSLGDRAFDTHDVDLVVPTGGDHLAGRRVARQGTE
ncbi:hypothetical protein [Streptomyces sp. WAC07061]|uniref:hypothetical protein n=1 Tax=Streptomyces sp. WAC07061 TaxID=2487410 RepID=UPI00163D1AAD|nr:hypothetical protein [Streptomyces sp. WAC07061]